MIVINQSNLDIIRQLGGYLYKTKTRNYRLNKYCLEHKIEEGYLIHNFFTGSTVMIKPFEYINIFTNDPCDYAEFLVNNYFIVPDDFDEKSLVDLFKERCLMPIISGYLDHPSEFVILSTTKCNARCFYCYELGVKNKTHMTYETAEKIASYIIEVAPKNKELSLSWFGGEPLFNSDVIEIITSRVSSARLPFRGSMITNGYLFDENLVKKAKNDWNIRNVQITLDGTETIYNKVKNYIYKDEESPYKRVLNNIKMLLDSDITVSVRMNCDTHNFDNLKTLVIELDKTFKDYGNFSMYVWPIFEEGFVRNQEQKKELYEAILSLEKIILELGYPMSHGITNNVKGVHCMVDSGESVIINPTGNIGLCEHYIDKNFIGHINNPYEKDMDIIKSWRDYTENIDICNDCPIYPQCLRMKKCPDECICEEFQKHYLIEHFKLAMEGHWITYNNSEDVNNLSTKN